MAAGTGEGLPGEVLASPEQGDLGEGELTELAASDTSHLQVLVGNFFFPVFITFSGILSYLELFSPLFTVKERGCSRFLLMVYFRLVYSFSRFLQVSGLQIGGS